MELQGEHLAKEVPQEAYVFICFDTSSSHQCLRDAMRLDEPTCLENRERVYLKGKARADKKHGHGAIKDGIQGAIYDTHAMTNNCLFPFLVQMSGYLVNGRDQASSFEQ